jgi:hypothetical protein
MIVALEQAVRRHHEAWTPSLEMATVAVELSHAHLLATLRANGAKNVGKPMHIPRPWEKKSQVKTITMGEFVRQTGGPRV